MADSALRRPVSFPPADWLVTTPPLARHIFRGNPVARAAASAAFGVDLPTESCRAAAVGARAALWLGPDEWLLLAPDDEHAAAGAALEAALSTLPHSLVDVSHRQVGLDVHGPRVEWLLESHCPLPLNLRDFPVGMCTRSVFAKTEIVLWRQAPERFHVEVWRSFSQYLVGLMQQVADETGPV
jgi:sarcosine oxidase subunit gamma